MDESIFFPSPNWFEPSTLAVGIDGWLVYGGPSKSICVLEPLPENYNTIVKGQQGYTAHVVNRAHPEKVVCVDLCPEWPEKRSFLAGSADGAVKQWSIEKIESGHLKMKSTHSHEMHRHEEVVGVGYCKDGYAITVGAHGNIVKWDLNSNVAKNFNNVLKTFKPTCIACSPHIHMNVAIGTKQGVVFVLDLNGSPRVIYKVRGQDNDVLKLSWCPQYEVAVRKLLKESDRRSTATQRMEKIRQEATSPNTLNALDERVKNSQTSEKPIKINEKSEAIVEDAAAPATEVNNESGVGKTLPDDSFDGEETIVQEDDMFDIYTDHAADEFGHKKYQPEDVLVRIPTETAEEDYLVECERLKEEILKRKAVSEASIETLVDAMEKVQVEAEAGSSKTQVEAEDSSSKSEQRMEGKIIKGEVESSVHIQKHLLASIGKHGSIRIWSKAGKLVASCVVFSGAAVAPKAGRNDKRMSTGACSTLVWCKPDSLLIADGKSQLLECNPLKIDCKNKLEWRILHTAHKRGMYAVATTAVRVQTPEMAARNAEVSVWSAAQDRSLVRYQLNSRVLHNYMTCGGFLYMLQHCPYDARKVAAAVGDGAVRIWEADTLEDDDSALTAGTASAYWNNVQGKVLAVAWHPTKENLLAFATAEARVGLLDISGKGEKPARVLQPSCAGGIYSLCWGERMNLYASGAGELLLYDAAHPDLPPSTASVELEGVPWEVSSVQYSRRGLMVGSNAGAVALCKPDFTVEAAAFLYKKMIHMTEWHPQETSAESEPSPYRDLIAVCALDRSGHIVILQYAEKEDGGKSLNEYKRLIGHSGPVLQVAWNPHKDHLLLSTSQDSTVRVWDVEAGSCMSIFGGHSQASLGVCWSALPAAPLAVLSGGADCTLRLWGAASHPPELYIDVKQEMASDKKKKNNKRPNKKKTETEEEIEEEEEKEKAESEDSEPEEQAVAALDVKRRINKKFLLPMVYRQTHPLEVKGIKKLLQKYYERNELPVPFDTSEDNGYGLDYIKIFGTINEVNELLDDEASRLLDMGLIESWVMLCIVRGHIDACVQLMAQRNLLDPFLVSIAPCVSFKYWKDTTLLYLQQIDRLAAKAEESKLCETRAYGGAVFRRMAVLLGLHDVRGAVTTLHQARLFKEAYVLSRTRYMDSLAEESLRLWANHTSNSGDPKMAAHCYIALGDLSQAAAALGKTSDEEALRLAADIATTLGQVTYAGHMHHQYQRILTQKLLEPQEPQEPTLEPLPTRTQLLLTESDQNENSDRSDPLSSSDSASTLKEHEKIENNESSIDTNISNTPDIQNKDLVEESSDNKEQVPISDDNCVDKKSSDTNGLHDNNKGDDVLNNENKEVVNESGDNKKTVVDSEEKDVVEESSDASDAEDSQNDESELENNDVAQVAIDVKFSTQHHTQQTYSNATSELLEQLPKMMKALMNESHQPVGPLSNGTHIGDGDAKQNGQDKASKAPETDLASQVNSAITE